MLQMWRTQENVSDARSAAIRPVAHQQQFFKDSTRTPLSVVDKNQHSGSVARWFGQEELLDCGTDSWACLGFDSDIQFGHKAFMQFSCASKGRSMEQDQGEVRMQQLCDALR
jgi:hypothetical protein